MYLGYSDVSTYVGLYGSGLFNFVYYVSLPTLFAYFLGFDIPASSFMFIENVFYYSFILQVHTYIYIYICIVYIYSWILPFIIILQVHKYMYIYIYIVYL